MAFTATLRHVESDSVKVVCISTATDCWNASPYIAPGEKIGGQIHSSVKHRRATEITNSLQFFLLYFPVLKMPMMF